MNLVTLFRKVFLDRPIDLIRKLSIKDKDGVVYKLDQLWPEQLTIIEHLLAGDSLVILKARQIGSTTACLACLFCIWWLSPDPIHIVILANKLDPARDLLERFYSMYESLPTEWKALRPLSVDNKNRIVLADSKAQVSAQTANSKGGIRSWSCQYLLMSEFAFMENPGQLLSASLPALNNGQLIIESTANYPGDELESQFIKARSGLTDRTALFFPWTCRPEYSVDPPDSFVLTSEELSAKLSPGQACWRRNKIQELTNIQLFKRDYPLTPEEAYATTPSSYIDQEHLSTLKLLPSIRDTVAYMESPQPDIPYTIGVDLSWGGGDKDDDSCIHVLNTRDMTIAAYFRSNKCSFVNLSDLIARLSIKYNNALINCEGNSKGAVVLYQLSQAGANLLTLPTGKTWETTSNTKPFIVDAVRTAITKQALQNLDEPTYHEIRNCTIDHNGKLVVSTILSSHGDGIISLGLALVAIEHLPTPKTVRPPMRHIRMRSTARY